MSYSGPELIIEIDYGKPIYEVCKDFLNHVFSRLGYIDMMCRPWAPESTSEHPWNPPSWMVPRNRVSFQLDSDQVYRRVRADPLVGSPDVKDRRNYSASGQSRAFPGKGNDRTEGRSYPPTIGLKCNLFVKGLQLARITEITLPASDGNIPPEWLKFFGWDPRDDTRPPNEFWRTLVGDRGLDEISDPPRYFRLACKVAFKKSQPMGLKTGDELTHGKCSSHMAEFLRRVQCVVWGRRLVFGTCPENGEDLLGLAPGDVEIGDLICILYGCCVPVILRPQNRDTWLAATKEAKRKLFGQREWRTQNTAESNEAGVARGSGSIPEETPAAEEHWFKFIGECYVQGMMSGEVFSHKKKHHGDGLGETDFEIR